MSEGQRQQTSRYDPMSRETWEEVHKQTQKKHVLLHLVYEYELFFQRTGS